ncbi:hypothetical protein GQX74_005635 [Glossina fuscipes]|nr:hypothetical protein GQX74_005635 [Glossina fuscipes]
MLWKGHLHRFSLVPSAAMLCAVPTAVAGADVVVWYWGVAIAAVASCFGWPARDVAGCMWCRSFGCLFVLPVLTHLLSCRFSPWNCNVVVIDCKRFYSLLNNKQL